MSDLVERGDWRGRLKLPQGGARLWVLPYEYRPGYGEQEWRESPNLPIYKGHPGSELPNTQAMRKPVETPLEELYWQLRSDPTLQKLFPRGDALMDAVASTWEYLAKKLGIETKQAKALREMMERKKAGEGAYAKPIEVMPGKSGYEL